jgi:hypothetical protein
MPMIKRAVNEQELEDIYRFRYRVYVEEMNRKQKYADHERKMVVEPLDASARLYGIWTGKEIVGTVRFNVAAATDTGYYDDLYSLDVVGPQYSAHTSLTTKLMVAKTHRNLKLAVSLACTLYRDGKKAGMEFDFIDCNDHLVPFFEYLGYRMFKGKVNHPEYGSVNPMVLVGSDQEHLEKVRSPFAPICREFPANNEAVEFFYSNFPSSS